MSYQSDLSDFSSISNSKAFVTFIPEPKKVRSKSPEKIIPPLEEIKEERGRCSSPQIRDWDPIRLDADADAYSDRLSAYLDEMQQALDYMEGVEEIVKDNADINAIT